ncbi:MAG: 30S ribosomal protein S6e [Candidatus Altiarchaeota archaeon]|nr:30S ribosomal protein S6e [Candidatus Altiarchaeota archaeon]
MDYKIVVSDQKTGKSYQVEAKDEKAKKIRGSKVGDKIDGGTLGLQGYKLEITGGSDKGGFPMKRGLHASNTQKILLGNGVGYKAKKGERARVRVHGEVVGDQIVQVNTRVIEYGGKPLDELLGKKEEPTKEGKSE